MAHNEGRKRDEIRLMALDAAEAIVATEGHTGLSARRIASAAGCTPGMLYLVFKNLGDLILQINGRTLDELYDHLRANYPENPRDDPERTLKALANAYAAYAEAEAPRWNMLSELTGKKGDIVPECCQRKLARIFGLAEAALRALTGDERKVTRASHVFWASIHGICTLRIRQHLSLPNEECPEEMAAMFIENFLRGLRG